MEDKSRSKKPEYIRTLDNQSYIVSLFVDGSGENDVAIASTNNPNHKIDICNWMRVREYVITIETEVSEKLDDSGRLQVFSRIIGKKAVR